MKSNRAFLALALLVNIAVSGCSKKPAPPPAASESKTVSLGTVELGYNTPERRDLGDGTVCILTAGQLDATSCELTAIRERAGRKIASSRVAPAALEKPMEISFGDIRVGLVLHIK